MQLYLPFPDAVLSLSILWSLKDTADLAGASCTQVVAILPRTCDFRWSEGTLWWECESLNWNKYFLQSSLVGFAEQLRQGTTACNNSSRGDRFNSQNFPSYFVSHHQLLLVGSYQNGPADGQASSSISEGLTVTKWTRWWKTNWKWKQQTFIHC